VYPQKGHGWIHNFRSFALALDTGGQFDFALLAIGNDIHIDQGNKFLISTGLNGKALIWSAFACRSFMVIPIWNSRSDA
jgi:hypothetical protein